VDRYEAEEEAQEEAQEMSRVSRDSPPPAWLTNVTTIDEAVGIYAWPSPEDGNDNPTIWHWCTDTDRWCAAGTRAHTLVAVDPLHLYPSLLYPCCGLHGWIQEGKWVPA
jgi:hypothetical protein